MQRPSTNDPGATTPPEASRRSRRSGRSRPVRTAVSTLALVFLAAFVALPDFAMPWHRCRRPGADAAAAYATLKNLSLAQVTLRETGLLDGDGDGIGEYGYFAELAGRAPLPGGALEPPLLSSGFAEVEQRCVERSGYRFQLWLPGPGRSWIPEAARGGRTDLSVDPDLAEQCFLAYAWPVARADRHGCGRHVRRVYMLTQDACIYACERPRGAYVGGRAPVPGVSGFEPYVDGWVPACVREDAFGDLWFMLG